MTRSPPLPILATHSGKFHCDEVFAYAVLRLALGLAQPGEDHVLLRTRKPELIETASIVWDVGFAFDAAANRFDHHQRGAPVRADGTPFSSAGLVWQAYGEKAVAALLRDRGGRGSLPPSPARSTRPWCGGSTRSTTALADARRDGLGLVTLIGEFNPTWDDPAGSGPTAGDAAFLEAAGFAAGVLRRRVEEMRARRAAEAIVRRRTGRGGPAAAGAGPRDALEERGLRAGAAVLFTVSPASNGNWMVDTMPPEPGSFDQRSCRCRRHGRGWMRRRWRNGAGWRMRCSCICGGSSGRRSRGRGRWRWRGWRWRGEPARRGWSVGSPGDSLFRQPSRRQPPGRGRQAGRGDARRERRSVGLAPPETAEFG